MDEDFAPLVEWTQDLSNHVLLIHLPGFKKEDIRVHVENYGRIQVKGKKHVIVSKYVNLDQSFIVPQDVVHEKIFTRLEDGILFLIMPKEVKESEVTRKAVFKSEWLDYVPTDRMLEKVNRNRKVISVAVVAFSVGLYVSHKLRASGR
ncbi:uncharacterized protein A4U43_C08F5650 [Asparagus officinalis]|uniref:17.6 kDa class I heat shock protein-like n=1 Tax=Asparagus officinalis TaxID=4686 RepID=UPI00098E37A0|nr:17.6 kDa class I heat shock protein-like [Asparagus officinalis]ONK59361.1 uncharacterized protein A4U43_C08F5650 [Asparagus officinalis]